MVVEKDIVIIGGGIAGLWLLDRLQHEGFDAALFDNRALGHGQSIASQGMIHGGMKYTLSGALTGASEAIAGMPAHWKSCLRGEGDVDLRGTRILSDNYYMWPRSSLRSRLNAFFGSKLVRGKVDKVSPALYPAFFRGHIEGPLYRLPDIVLDVPSLLQTLAANNKQWIHKIDWKQSRLQRGGAGGIDAIALPNGVTLRARRFVFTCGEGAQDFLQAAENGQVAMQKRPLHMVVVKHNIEAPLYVHCVSDHLQATPELTITTHQCSDGTTAWYLGGQLAESGVTRDDEEQQNAARAELTELFPWCDLSGATFHSKRIDRAEARQADGGRPDNASVLVSANMLYCWPTKLTLAPALSTRVLQTLRQQGIAPSGRAQQPLQGLQIPAVATPPWEAC